MAKKTILISPYFFQLYINSIKKGCCFATAPDQYIVGKNYQPLFCSIPDELTTLVGIGQTPITSASKFLAGQISPMT